MDLFRGGQMLIHGNVTLVRAGSPVEWLRHSHDRAADDGSDLLDRYLEGWAENNLSKISSAMAPGYCFDDPHVGQFSRWSISLYFEGFGQDSRESVDARLGTSAFSSTGRPTGQAVAASSRSFVKRPDWANRRHDHYHGGARR
jgi:hypothetical protein